MLTDDIVVTRNEAVSADTFNVDRCDYQSLWCKRYCYGRKLTGRAYVARQWRSDFVDGKIVQHCGPSPRLRPFTVIGDVPKRRGDRQRFERFVRKLFPRYEKVWLPTRSWSDDGGLEYLADIMDEHENVAVTLSFDGSMSVKTLMTATDRFRTRYGDRTSLATVTEAPYTDAERENVDALLALGYTHCPKTHGAGSCHTCGRLCWAEHRATRLSAIGLPIIGFKYHR